jgi:mono/diheme cytochrome c family protein
VLPRLDWRASNPPAAVEQALARTVLERWIHRSERAGTNPIVPTAENLKAARTEYEAHCAACHGLDGSGRNQFEAEFSPPVASSQAASKSFPTPRFTSSSPMESATPRCPHSERLIRRTTCGALFCGCDILEI